MAVGMQGGAPEPPALSIHPIDFRTDPDTIRATWRVTGGLLIFAGIPYLATTVLYSVAGNVGRAMFAAIVAAALFIGGTSLLAQRYSAGPDTARRSTGIVGLAIGPGALVYSLQNLSAGPGRSTWSWDVR
jgi:phosphotransferase system  glucose/maltose/N-acetylglucosamine-specific IIC component